MAAPPASLPFRDCFFFLTSLLPPASTPTLVSPLRCWIVVLNTDRIEPLPLCSCCVASVFCGRRVFTNCLARPPYDYGTSYARKPTLLAAYRRRQSTRLHPTHTKHLPLPPVSIPSWSCAVDNDRPTSSPPWEGGMSPQLKELLVPQFVQDRKSSAMDEAAAGLEACDLSYVYYTTDSSSSDIASPLTPTFSNRGGVPLRYSSSTSSLELPSLQQEGPTSPIAQHSTASKSSIRPLPDVQEEPLEPEQDYDEEEYDDDEEYDDNLSDTFGMYCLCKLEKQSQRRRGWLADQIPLFFLFLLQVTKHVSTKMPLESFCETKSRASMTSTTTLASSATAISLAIHSSPGRSVTSAARPWRPSPRALAAASPALPDGRLSARQTASRA